MRGCITAERKGQNGSWHEEDGEKLSQLKSGEIRKLNLGREQVRNLFSGLGALIKAGEEHGVELDLPDLIVARRENIVEVSCSLDRNVAYIVERYLGALHQTCRVEM